MSTLDCDAAGVLGSIPFIHLHVSREVHIIHTMYSSVHMTVYCINSLQQQSSHCLKVRPSF